MLDLRALRQVIALAQHRNFARAAEALDVTQPALSRGIATLEERLGVRLFDRGRGGVEVTAFGKLLLERGRGLVRGAEETERAIARMREAQIGELTVVGGPFPVELSLGLAVARLVRKHPGLSARLSVIDSGQARGRVLAGDVDLAVAEVFEAERDPHLRVERLPPHQGVFFCRAGHPILAEAKPSLARVLAFPLATVALSGRLAPLLADASPVSGALDRDAGTFVPRICIDGPATSTLVVKESDAIGLAVPHAIAADLRSGALVALAIEAPWARTAYGFIALRDRTPAPAVLAFMDEVRGVEAEIGAGEPALLAAVFAGTAGARDAAGTGG